MSELVVVLTTVPADFDAAGLAQDLVTAGLVACVTILPGVTSVYMWDGTPQVDREQQLVMKTSAAATDALLEVLRTRHPYELPEFIVLPIAGGSEDYLAWVEKSVGPQRES